MEAFERYERLLWRVLSRLAAEGYVPPPGEARDLVHDFYVESWGQLVRSFDPAKGRFATLLFTAFYRFARRRILRWRQWHRPLRALREAADRGDDAPAPGEGGEPEPRLLAVRAALRRLPPLQREVLYDFLLDPGGERALALRHGLTRYRLRETLVDALGRVVTELGEGLLPGAVEAKVALALWRDGCSVRQAGQLLGLPAAEVQAARRRLVGGLLGQLRALPPAVANEGNVHES